MTERPMKSSEVVNWEELIVSNMIQIEAIINVLERKNIASKDEILDEVKNINTEMQNKIKNNQKMN